MRISKDLVVSWKADSSEVFSCKSVFLALLNYPENPRFFVVRNLWQIQVPIKENVLSS